MSRLVVLASNKRHMKPVVIVTIKAHGIRFNSVLHKADCFVQCDCWFIWHVHLQVDSIHAVVEGMLKRGVYNLPTQASSPIARRSENTPHHHFVM